MNRKTLLIIVVSATLVFVTLSGIRVSGVMIWNT
jgi:hypothetical protein